MYGNLSQSMLVPDANDVAWTHLSDGIFNSPGSSLTSPSIAASNPQGVSCTLTPIALSVAKVFSGMVLAANPQRQLLILQNTSTATAPDFAPAIYINFKQSAQVGAGILLPPGVGLVFDTSTPIDAVYLTYGAFLNTGGTVKISAIVGEGVQPGGAAGAAQAAGGAPVDMGTAIAALAQAAQSLQAMLQGG